MQGNSGDSSARTTDFESVLLPVPFPLLVMSAPTDDSEFLPAVAIVYGYRIENGRLAGLAFEGESHEPRARVLLAPSLPHAQGAQATLAGLPVHTSHAQASVALRSLWDATRRAQRRLGAV
jgi:hypothetical protein